MAKSKNPLAFIYEPIDWAALAIRYRENSKRTRKGDKRPREEVEKLVKARRENAKRRQREAADRRYPETRKRVRPWWRYVAVMRGMEPGRWYASPDVAQMLGLKSSEAFSVLLRMRDLGFVDSAKNPDWVPHVYQKGLGIHLQAKREPKVLWSLTAAGVAKRAEALAGGPAEAVQCADGPGTGQSAAGVGEATGDLGGADSGAGRS